LDAIDARGPIGAEQHAEEFGYGVIELLAAPRILELVTTGAGRDVLSNAASPYFAPSGVCLIVAARALLFEIGFASTAVKATVGNQLRFR